MDQYNTGNSSIREGANYIEIRINIGLYSNRLKFNIDYKSLHVYRHDNRIHILNIYIE